MNNSKLIILTVGLLMIGLFFYLGLGGYMTIEQLVANRQQLQQYYVGHAVLMVTAFMAIYIMQTALSLPGATILSLAAGAVFSPWLGTLYAVTAASLGATLAFLVTRYLLRDAVLHRFGAKLEGINRELEQRGLNYLLFLRLVPLFPFFLINLAAGLTRLRLSTFVLGTFFGIIPGGFVYVNAGASLATISSLSDITSPRIWGAFALLGLFALIPALYAKLKDRNVSPL